MSSRPSESLYNLDELTALAETTPRTVRYYIAEGLLPPAVSAGPRSGYTDAHLDRLRLINRMKEAFLPLREIRHRLAGLDDDAIRETLRALEEERKEESAQPFNSAADYIAGLLGDQEARPPTPASFPASASFPAPPGPAAGGYDTWRRLPITSDAELLIRDDAYRRRADQIDTLITWARRILS